MNIEQILSKLGVKIHHVNSDEAQGYCPAHPSRMGHEDSHPSWYINLDSGLSRCYSCGWKANLPMLVAECLDLKLKYIDDAYNIAAANAWLEGRLTVDLDYVRERLKAAQVDVYEDTPVSFNLEKIALFDDPPEWALQERRLIRESVDHYSVRWADQIERRDGDVQDVWITPIKDPRTGLLVGWQEKSQSSRYFKNSPPRVPKSHSLFGWDTYVGGIAVVVESPLDAVRLHSAGYHGIATYGASLSPEQHLLLKQVDELINALDNPFTDAAGKKALAECVAYAQRFEYSFKAFNYRGIDAKDPGEMTDAEIHQGIENAVSISRGKRALGLV